MKTLGICFGASTISIVELEYAHEIKTIIKTTRIVHEGNPLQGLSDWFKTINPEEFNHVAVTGRSMRDHVEAASISEPEAIEEALEYAYGEGPFPTVVVSLGGETQIAYQISKTGTIDAVYSGNKCASGTGEFFLQQIRRMGLSLDDAVEMARKGEAHKIAGRCSVFCKSDCTHALNKGESKENVVAGLCAMMADKIVELIKDLPIVGIGLIGGGSQNDAMIRYLRNTYSDVNVARQAIVFEALGAALWAGKKGSGPLPKPLASFFRPVKSSFGTHAPLKNALSLVRFSESHVSMPMPGDECVIGLDVGSTTTKAVLMRRADSSILASTYLRTSGNPVAAAISCYSALQSQVHSTPLRCVGLGVTGSGRHIAALHASTDTIINEIVAHATAAAFYDPQVDTIFEIGGQDAKYTFLSNGIPSDYAMNEACSAGTGSFLEEAAFESLSVTTGEIGDLAMEGMRPLNFTDQCSAFISSDIKRAIQEKIDRNDILAGLVYSICLNYQNRVKGSRPVGKKIFMQGGVCYNKAVPVAMASLLQCEIIVPPDPGLSGAVGVALQTSRRLTRGSIEPKEFKLEDLISRTVAHEGSFVCQGTKGGCDRKCAIQKYRIAGELVPFGGACNKYYNQRHNISVDTDVRDLVAVRQHLVFEQFGITGHAADASVQRQETVGISRSFLAHSLFPLYSHFFAYMGFNVVVSDKIDPQGLARTLASYCLPVEIAHGSFLNVLKQKPDYIFLPQVMQLPVPNVPTYSRLCVFVQGEPYYLETTFRDDIAKAGVKILRPVLRMETGFMQACETLVAMAMTMGVDKKNATRAFEHAVSMQHACDNEMRVYGKQALEYLAVHPSEVGIVLFGRPYNAFTSDAHMGIPKKIASRGYYVIPLDMLPADRYSVDEKMFWAMGQKIMKSAQFVKDTPNLFGVFVTNFSCGPDSFLLGFFRTCMGDKPSLTLELDHHTADAGIDTRIEAAIDIFRHCVEKKNPDLALPQVYVPARVAFTNEIMVTDSYGNRMPIDDPRVEVLLPSMGTYATEIAAAVLRSRSIRARALPVIDDDVFLVGRKNTSTKECLPYIITTGSFLSYLHNTKRDPHTVTLLLMATGGGPCRLGQYCRALEQKIHADRLVNVAVLTITDENGYAGLGARTLLRAWQSLVVADVFSDLKSMLQATARDPAKAQELLRECWTRVVRYFDGSLSIRLSTLLGTIAEQVDAIELDRNPREVPVISLVGEIFVRRDEFSRKNLIDYLESKGFMVRIAPISEYPLYGNYVINQGLGERKFTIQEKVKMHLTARIQEWWEWRIKSIFGATRLYHPEMIDIAKTIKGVKHIIDENFRGECILTVGLAMREIAESACGIISIGPFGCMPSRMAEAILKKEMNPSGKKRMATAGPEHSALDDVESFPFLAIEADGTAFPQLTIANLESFVLKSRAMHARMQAVRTTHERHRRKRHEHKS